MGRVRVKRWMELADKTAFLSLSPGKHGCKQAVL